MGKSCRDADCCPDDSHSQGGHFPPSLPMLRRRAGTTSSARTGASAETEHLLTDEFCETSRRIAFDLVAYTCGRRTVATTDKTIITLRRLVDDTLHSRLSMMREMASYLAVKRRDQLKLIDNIACEMFSDQIVNWGRIVTLIAFSGYLARHCQETGIVDNCVADVSEIVSEILINRLGLWLVINGGWESVDKEFPALCSLETSGLWKGVLVVALFLGIIIACFSSACIINP